MEPVRRLRLALGAYSSLSPRSNAQRVFSSSHRPVVSRKDGVTTGARPMRYTYAPEEWSSLEGDDGGRVALAGCATLCKLKHEFRRGNFQCLGGLLHPVPDRWRFWLGTPRSLLDLLSVIYAPLTQRPARIRLSAGARHCLLTTSPKVCLSLDYQLSRVQISTNLSNS